MAKTIVILAGIANSGKSGTLRKLKTKYLKKAGGRCHYRLDGKDVCVFLTSLHETVSDFCNHEKVIVELRKRIKTCSSYGISSFIITPFGIQNRGSKLNEKYIVKPIEMLKKEGWNVRIAYLRRTDTGYLSLKDGLMRQLNAYFIDSKKNEEERQADEFFKVVKKADP